MPNIKVTLSEKMCNCGSVYAVPHWVPEHKHTCPMCANKRIREANECEQERSMESMRKDYTIASLRGAITRMKRASKGAK